MNSPQATPPDVDRSEGDDIDWRTALVARLRLVVVILIFLGGIATMLGARSELMRGFGVAVIILSVLMIGLLWSPQLSTRLKSIIMIAGLSAISITAYIISAYMPGGAMTVMFILVLTSLLIGRKAFIWLLIAFTFFAIGLVVAVSTGWWSGPALVDINPADPMNWSRVTLIAILFWASLGFSVLFVVDAIEQHLSRRVAALESLRQENAERRAAEHARREAEAIAVQAQKLEAVGQLAAGIAHDFNNALLVIQGWNEIRSTMDSDAKQREATTAIQQAVDHTTQLSKQLLTFARKDVRTPRHLYLDRVVEKTTKTLKNLVGARINMHIESQPDKVIFADESQIQQLLFNLVINARDAIESTGNISIVIRAAEHGEVEAFASATPDWIALEVKDDGHGIDDEIKAHMFEPFFTTKESGVGSGLGLSTVFGIVQQNGGHISVSSEPGETVFSMYFPSANVYEIDTPAKLPLTDASLLELRVLVLEDDALARQMLVTILEKSGCEVVSCADGDAALALFNIENRPFDILCSDAVFPGAELAAVLEAFEKHSPSAKVMICSGYVQQELAIRKVESGEYAFFAKPFTAAAFIEKIRETSGMSEPSD